MTNHQYVTVTRTLLKRGITDIERKLAAAATSGALGYVLLSVLEAYGVKVPAQLADLIPYASAILGGYVAHSVGAQTHSVVTEPTGRVTETTTTGAIALPVEGASFRVPATAVPSSPSGPPPVVPPMSPPVEDPAPADPTPYEVPDKAYMNMTPVVEETVSIQGDDGQTQILPPSAGAQAWAARYLRTSDQGSN